MTDRKIVEGEKEKVKGRRNRETVEKKASGFYSSLSAFYLGVVPYTIVGNFGYLNE